MEQKYSNTLVSSRKDGKLAYTKHLFDVPKDKSQEDINKEFYTAMTKLATAITTVADDVSNKWAQHQEDIKNQKAYTDSRTQAISTEKIKELAKQYLD